MKTRLRSAPRAGFTLLELIVVLTIIATIAGLVIPQVAMLGRTADMAASAKTQQDLANNLQTFFVLQKRFPQYMDSLLVSPSSGSAPTDVYRPVTSPTTSLQIAGLPASSPALHADLVLGTLTSNQRRSFTRCGFDFVMDHDSTLIDSNDSGVFQRALPSTGTMLAAVIRPHGTATPSPAALKALPGTQGVPPDGAQLVAVGIGPRSSCIPKTMLNAPIYPGCDGTYYGRYIAVFMVYETGERATLVGVCDSYGRFPDYTIQQYVESLPNDARQG